MTFSVSEIILAEIKQHYLFYMNSGSNVTVSACFVDGAAIIPLTSLYISRGIDAYNGGYSRSDIKSVVTKAINSYNLSYSHNDFYYFIFQTSSYLFQSSISRWTYHMISLAMLCMIKLPSPALAPSLSTSNYGSTCSLSVPLSSNTYAFLTVQPVSSDVDM